MRREWALKVVLVLVGLLFTALVYPMMMFVKQEPALAMMLSVYVRQRRGRTDDFYATAAGSTSQAPSGRGLTRSWKPSSHAPLRQPR
jgi:hypothetical protein